MIKREVAKGPRLLAKEVKLSVKYDKRRRCSKIIADFGPIQWVAGPWPGDYRGKEAGLWNKHRDRFIGEMLEVRDSLPQISQPQRATA